MEGIDTSPSISIIIFVLVEMSAARWRALTQISQYSNIFSVDVEMSAARWRALTLGCENDCCTYSLVEMSAARWRALTHCSELHLGIWLESRNECGPLEGIDTSFIEFIIRKFIGRNECGPFEGIDTIFRD